MASWIAYKLSFSFINKFRELRRRILILPFEIKSHKDPKEIQALADAFMHSIVSELFSIAKLSNMNTIETASPIRMDSDEVRILSKSLDVLALDKLSQVTTVELSAANLKIPIPNRIIALILQSLALVRLHGNLTMRSDNLIEIYIEGRVRNSSNHVYYQETLLPKFLTNTLTKEEVSSSARKIALNIAMGLGVGQPFIRHTESLDAYLNGLNASNERRWWDAIACYRKAIELEETTHEEFGLGHYLMGAALVSLGSFKRGLIRLQMAEQQGPQLAEIHYMLALTRLYEHHYKLDKEPTVIREIIRHCVKACRLKKNFAEAYQLLGVSYYILGRLQDRRGSRKYGTQENSVEKQKLLKNAKNSYKLAMVNFTFAASIYRKKVLSTGTTETQFDKERQKQALMNLVVVMHQLADSLRGLNKYWRASFFYLRTLDILPQNLRTLIDLAKTYCLWKKWDEAYNVTYNQLTKTDLGRWDADVQFYLGWACFGQVSIENTFENKQKRLSKGLRAMDYALHQRPRFMTYWRQNNWVEAYNRAIEQLPRVKINSTLSNPIDPEIANWWLGRRLFSYSMTADDISPAESIVWKSYNLEKYKKSNRKVVNERELKRMHRFELSVIYRLKLILDELQITIKPNSVAEQRNSLWRQIRENKNLISKEVELKQIYSAIEYLKSANDLKGLWKDCFQFFSEIKNGFEPTVNTAIKLSDRSFVDTFAEVASLTALILSKVHDYHTLYEVAHKSGVMLQKWADHWEKTYAELNGSFDKKNGFLFSPMVLRYQRASLHSWAAYALMMQTINPFGRIQWIAIKTGDGRGIQQTLEMIYILQKEARTIAPMHPLAMYVRAQLLIVQKQYHSAIALLDRLIKRVEPFDPSRTISRPGRNSKKEDIQNSIRSKLYFQEKLTGRQRFDEIVNPTNIQKLFAVCYRGLEQSRLGVEHFAKAISIDSPEKMSVRDFLILANRLKNIEHFEEAESILEAINISSRGSNFDLNFSLIMNLGLDVSRAIINSRRGFHERALTIGTAVASAYYFLDYLSLKEEFQDLIAAKKTSPNFDLSELDEVFEMSEAEAEAEAPFRLQQNIHSAIKKTLKISMEGHRKRLFRIIKNDHISYSVKMFNSSKLIPIDIVIPEVFKRLEREYSPKNSLKDNPKTSIVELKKILNLSTYRLQAYNSLCSQNPIANFLNSKNISANGSAEFLSEDIFKSYTLFEFSNSAVESLIRLADLSNALAYAKAEIETQLNLAIQEARFAITLLRFLYGQIPDLVEDPLVPRLKSKLAHYYDTLAWIHFRAANTDSSSDKRYFTYRLPKALAFANQALEYDQQFPVLYYHLSRIHLAILEGHWQTLPTKTESELAKIAPLVDKHLRLAFRHWQSARKFDKTNRLQTQLTWLGQRIDNYIESWKDMHLSSFRETYTDPRVLFRLGDGGQNHTNNRD